MNLKNIFPFPKKLASHKILSTSSSFLLWKKKNFLYLDSGKILVARIIKEFQAESFLSLTAYNEQSYWASNKSYRDVKNRISKPRSNFTGCSLISFSPFASNILLAGNRQRITYRMLS